MKFMKLKESDNALVGIVVTFLLIGLIVSVLSIIQTVYLPKWMEQTESEHMDVVANQFAQLKSAIDMQGVIGSNQLTPTSISTISTAITLGSRELPFLMSTRAFGSLNILPETSFRIVIENTSEIFENSSSTIQYISSNAYFLDQSYNYEAGAVILSQEGGDIMVAKPSFFVVRRESVNISFTMIKLSKVGGKGTISGYGSYPIHTEYSSNQTSIIHNVISMTIFTQYQNAWALFMNGMFINGGLEYFTDYTIDTSNVGEVSVSFTTGTGSTPVNINLYLIKISAQIAPGWVENTKG